MPELLNNFREQFPDTWKAYEQLIKVTDQDGPLDGKTVELIKVGISAALEHEGGLIAHISQSKKAGSDSAEIYHAILLAIGLAGIPAVLASFGIARNYLEGR